MRASAYGLTVGPKENWRVRSACIDDPERQYPHDQDQAGIRLAKMICRICPVQADCLVEALTFGERFGIWGGTTPKERRRMVAGTPLKTCADCAARFVPRGSYQYRCTPCTQPRDRRG
jgi:WhiB family redox-sensing transcriptional regulator